MELPDLLELKTEKGKCWFTREGWLALREWKRRKEIEMAKDFALEGDYRLWNLITLQNIFYGRHQKI